MVVFLLSFNALAGTISNPPPSPEPPYVAADYSWTQLWNSDDPDTLALLNQMVNSLGPGAFLSTGNSNYNTLWQQLMTVNSPWTPSPVSDIETPEPASIGLLLLGVGVVLQRLRERPVEVEEFQRR